MCWLGGTSCQVTSTAVWHWAGTRPHPPPTGCSRQHQLQRRLTAFRTSAVITRSSSASITTSYVEICSNHGATTTRLTAMINASGAQVSASMPPRPRQAAATSATARGSGMSSAAPSPHLPPGRWGIEDLINEPPFGPPCMPHKRALGTSEEGVGAVKQDGQVKDAPAAGGASQPEGPPPIVTDSS